MSSNHSLAVFTLFAVTSSQAFENREAKDDAAAIQLEGYFGLPSPAAPFEADAPFSRLYGYSFFPIAKPGGKDLAGALEASVVNREFRNGNDVLNFTLLQSYGLGLGYEAVKTKRHSGFFYGLVGINSDMRAVGAKDLYGDASYLHRFTASEHLTFGGGFDVHMYLGEYFPYPLFYLDWLLARHTKLKVNFDTGEIKQFLTDRLSVSLGAQYDIFHYGLGQDGGYVLETSSTMLRVEYRLGENIFARLSAKKPHWGGEKIEDSAGRETAFDADKGLSLRFQVAYGMPPTPSSPR